MAYDRGAYKWVGIEEDQEWEAAILMKVLQSGNSQMDAEQKARRGAYMTEFGISDLDEGFDPGEDWEQKSG